MRTSTLVSLLACACGAVPPDLDARLTRAGACADLVFWAADERDGVMLTVRAPRGLVADATRERRRQELVTWLPDDEVILLVETGRRVSDIICDGAQEGAGPAVTSTWSAASGLVTLRVQPPLEPGAPPLASLIVTDLELVRARAAGSPLVEVGRIEIPDVEVGWTPR